MLEPEMRSLLICGAIGLSLGCGGGATTHDALRPDPAIVHYRFALTGADESTEYGSTIAALEARDTAMPSPFDAGELAEIYYARAQLTGDRADYAASEKFGARSLALLAKPNPVLITMAKLANARHEFRDAIAIAHRQLDNKVGAAPYLAIATADLALGELPAAAEAANRALAIRPDSNGYATRALVMQAQGRDDEAALDFSRAAATEPPGDRHGAAHLRSLWGRFLLRRGDYRGAGLVIDEALRIVPDSPIALAQRGELLLRSGKPAEAVTWFDRAFERSHQVRYLIDEARARELAGDRATAGELRVQIEAIVRGQLAEDARGHQVDLIEVLVDRGDHLDEAVARGADEIARRGSFEVRYHYARALFRVGRIDDAAVQIEAALAAGTREAQVYELAARIERARHHADRAAVFEREADVLDPARSGWRALGLVPSP